MTTERPKTAYRFAGALTRTGKAIDTEILAGRVALQSGNDALREQVIDTLQTLGRDLRERERELASLIDAFLSHSDNRPA